MTFKLIAVPGDRVSLDTTGQAHIIGQPGPFEVVNNQNVAALLASVDKVAVTREALAVILNYAHHLNIADVEWQQAMGTLDQEMMG